MTPSPLLKKTLQRNHDRSNTTTFDAILTSLMGPLTISTIAQYPSAEAVPLQQLVGNEFDALIEWFASSSATSSPSGSASMPDSCSGGKVHHLSAEKRASEMDKEKDAVGYDPSNPQLSLPMTMLMRGRERGAYPLPPDPTPPSLPAPSLPPTPLARPVKAPRSSSSSITSTPRHPYPSTSSPLPTSQLLFPSSASSNIANLPFANERGKPHWKGDRRRLDAMKQRRIEERRERRGRDPVTGAKVVVVEGE
ncbi:MAG: hypothetical protein LQ337_001077, partial [Flavoplaca oasis]